MAGGKMKMLWVIEIASQSVPSLVISTFAIWMAVQCRQSAYETERHLRDMDDRIARIRDRLNEQDGSVRTIPLTDEQREGLTVHGPASPLPVAKVVRR